MRITCMEIGLMCKVHQPEWSVLVVYRQAVHRSRLLGQTWAWLHACMHAWACVHQSPHTREYFLGSPTNTLQPPLASWSFFQIVKQSIITYRIFFFLRLNYLLIGGDRARNKCRCSTTA